jgi:hypothetical protein
VRVCSDDECIVPTPHTETLTHVSLPVAASISDGIPIHRYVMLKEQNALYTERYHAKRLSQTFEKPRRLTMVRRPSRPHPRPHDGKAPVARVWLHRHSVQTHVPSACAAQANASSDDDAIEPFTH